jgi:hypothetical protein
MGMPTADRYGNRKARCLCAMAVIAVGSVLAGSALPAQAESIVSSAFDACTLPAISAEERLNLLAKAGWRTADDTAETRALLVLGASTRFPSFFDADTQKNVDSLAKGLATPLDLTLLPDQPPDLAALQAAAVSGRLPGIELSHPGLQAALLFSLTPTTDAYGLSCSLSLDNPLTNADRAALIAARQPLDDKTSPAAPDSREARYFYQSPSGSGDLTKFAIFDIGPDSHLHAQSDRAGSSLRLMTQITTTHGPFPLEAAP